MMRQILDAHDWLLKFGLLFVLGALVSVLEWLIYWRLLPRFVRKQRVWRVAFLEALHLPFQLFIWFFVISFMASVTVEAAEIDGGFLYVLEISRYVALLLFLFWFGMRFARYTEDGVTAQVQAGFIKIRDETSVHAIVQVLRVVLLITFLLMLLQTLGVRMSALLAFGGIGGAIIGFAAKDSLANFIGGMMIYWDRPFSVGDWIRSPDREIEGTVEDIGWRLTRIRTFDLRPLYVPNGVLSNIAIENPSRMWNRRIHLRLGVRYRDVTKIPDLTQAIEAMLRDHPDIDTQRALFVNLYEFGSYALNILIYAYVKKTQWIPFQAVQQDILLKISDIVLQHGAACAYPTQTIDIPPDIVKTMPQGEKM